MSDVLRGWIKYYGGKRSIAAQVIDLLRIPDAGEVCVVSPFVGGGAVEILLVAQLGPRLRPLIVADANPAVRALYRHGIRLEPARAALALTFSDLRKQLNQMATSPMLRERKGPELASFFWAYNRRSMNGLVRMNQAGEFNAPQGSRKGGEPQQVSEKLLIDALSVSALVLSAKPRVYEDCVQAVRLAPSGSRIYADPPYTGGFVGYSKGGWSTDDDIRLCEALRDARERGCRVVLSQPDTEWARQLAAQVLKGFEVVELTTPRPGNSDGEGRDPAKELLVHG